MPLSPAARDLVIRVILAEAEGEGPEGQLAVANVINNRSLSGAWGDRETGGLTRLLTSKGQFAAPKNVSQDDPMYRQVAAIVDRMATTGAPDNTGGATHFYAPQGMQPVGRVPDWAVGRQGRKIGNQLFYSLPLNASNTAGAVDLHAPPPGAAPGGSAKDDGSKAFLSSLSAHTDRPGDTANLNPQFATRLASAIKQAQAAGLNVSLESAFREPGQLKEKGDTSQASAYDAGGNSSHSYGLAVDIRGLDGPNGPITQRWAQIAQANGLNNPYGVGNAKEFNHWQLPAQPLERTPQLLASLKAAKASGDVNAVWSAYSGASPESQVATRQSYPPVASAGAAPAPAPAAPADVPAAQAQPVSAKAPAGQPAASLKASDANARYQVLQGMTTGGGGQGGRNPFLYTAMNLAPGAGTPAAPAPAAQTARPDLAQRAPLDQAPQPPARPANLGSQPTTTVVTPPERPGSPMSSLVPNWGATVPNDPNTLPGRDVNNELAMTPGGPSMGYPAVTNPFADSMQRLLQGLFPTR
jgi:hypothetical protein